MRQATRQEAATQAVFLSALDEQAEAPALNPHLIGGAFATRAALATIVAASLSGCPNGGSPNAAGVLAMMGDGDEANGAAGKEGGKKVGKEDDEKGETPLKKDAAVVKAVESKFDGTAPVKTTNAIAAVGSKETSSEVPKEWRWFYSGVNGDFHIVLEPTEDGRTKFRVEVVKSHRVKPEKAPKATLPKRPFPKNEEEARRLVVAILAKWAGRTFEEQEKLLSGALFREGIIKFERVASR